MPRLLPFVLAALLPVPALAAHPSRFVLHAGQAVLWNGPHIESSSGGEAFDYTLKVVEPAHRLRIGIDHPEVGDVFEVRVTTPGGSTRTFGVGPGIYSGEALFAKPQTGAWRVRVTAEEVSDSAFRMRAKLEAAPPSLGSNKERVLPNLQVLPPHDAAFVFPLTNGSSDLDPTGVSIAGRAACHPEEHVEDGALRCLRFGFGVRNTGVGPMDLSHRGGAVLTRELFQRIYRADGSSYERPAGKAVYHKTHGHWHHADAVALQLFEVTDRKNGKLAPAGNKRAKGFAHRNELLRDWDRFYPTLDLAGFGLRPGWADIYEWDRPGNYIDFALNKDGYYVVRMWADPVDGIIEMNERDNLGYTYMKIEGNEVVLLEAGRGRDPWDACKIVVGFGGHPDPKPATPRPAHCPPDTT